MLQVSCKTLFLFLLLSLSFCCYDYYIIGSSHHSFSPTVYSVSVKNYLTWKEESSKPFLDLPLIIELIFLFTFLSMFLSSPLIICVWHGTMVSLLQFKNTFTIETETGLEKCFWILWKKQFYNLKSLFNYGIHKEIMTFEVFWLFCGKSRIHG